MKKLSFILALAGLTMTSCKKNYTCECVEENGDPIITYTAKMKKSDAETWCKNWDSGVAAGGTGDKCTLSK